MKRALSQEFQKLELVENLVKETTEGLGKAVQSLQISSDREATVTKEIDDFVTETNRDINRLHARLSSIEDRIHLRRMRNAQKMREETQTAKNIVEYTLSSTVTSEALAHVEAELAKIDDKMSLVSTTLQKHSKEANTAEIRDQLVDMQIRSKHLDKLIEQKEKCIYQVDGQTELHRVLCSAIAALYHLRPLPQFSGLSEEAKQLENEVERFKGLVDRGLLNREGKKMIANKNGRGEVVDFVEHEVAAGVHVEMDSTTSENSTVTIHA